MGARRRADSTAVKTSVRAAMINYSRRWTTSLMALQAAKGALMKIAIVGVGAIGGYVGIRLALAGEDVTFIARGANLQALRSNGLRLQMSDGTEESLPRVNATSDYAEAGSQDVVILAMKAHQVEA